MITFVPASAALLLRLSWSVNWKSAHHILLPHKYLVFGLLLDIYYVMYVIRIHCTIEYFTIVIPSVIAVQMIQTEDYQISSASVIKKTKSWNNSRGISFSFLWWIISEIQLSKLWRTNRVQRVDICLVCGCFFFIGFVTISRRKTQDKMYYLFCFLQLTLLCVCGK